MKASVKVIGVVALAALLFGCNGDGENSSGNGIELEPPVESTVVEGEERTLFPLVEGNKWVYQVQQTAVLANRGTDTTDSTVEFTVTEARTEGDTTYATVSVTNDGTLVNEIEWMVDPSGIHYIASTRYDNSGSEPVATRHEYNPPQIVVKFPIEKGEEFIYEGTGPVPLGQPTKMTVTNRTLGEQVVDTLMGEAADFVQLEAEAVYSETAYTETSENQPVQSVATSWWAPGIGMVRLKQTTVSPNLGVSIEQTFRLEDYTVK